MSWEGARAGPGGRDREAPRGSVPLKAVGGRAAFRHGVLSGLWDWGSRPGGPQVCRQTGWQVHKAAKGARVERVNRFRGRGFPSQLSGPGMVHACTLSPLPTRVPPPERPPPSLGQNPGARQPGPLRAEPAAPRGAVHSQMERRPPPAVRPAPRILTSPRPAWRTPAAQHLTPTCVLTLGPNHHPLAAFGPMPALLEGRGSPAGPPLPAGQPSE